VATLPKRTADPADSESAKATHEARKADLDMAILQRNAGLNNGTIIRSFAGKARISDFQAVPIPVSGFAGLKQSLTGSHGDCRPPCALLARAANELGRPLHDRMPVILPLAFHDEWLNPQADAQQWLQSALCPFPGQEMEAVPVSSWVNDARHEGPECIQPV